MARNSTTTSNQAKTAAASARTRRTTAEARESVDDIRADMAELKSRLEAMASAGGTEGLLNVQQMFGRMQDRFNHLVDVARDTDYAEQLGLNAAMEKGREKAEEAREKIQENPLQSVLIAAGVGAIVGFLMRR